MSPIVSSLREASVRQNAVGRDFNVNSAKPRPSKTPGVPSTRFDGLQHIAIVYAGPPVLLKRYCTPDFFPRNVATPALEWTVERRRPRPALGAAAEIDPWQFRVASNRKRGVQQ
jgi:hypothetical protein